MKSLVFLLTAALLLATGVQAILVAERMPDGIYCGEYSLGLIKGNVTTREGTDTFSIFLEGLGSDLHCENEKYIYNPKTHHAKVVGADDPENCIGKVLVENKLTLEVVYAPKTDIITLDLGITQIDCKKCGDLRASEM